MTYTFEVALTVFLVMVIISQLIAGMTKMRLGLPLVLGVLGVVGFHYGWIPKDIAELSNMKAVGFIAFNVLVIHSGTAIDRSDFRRYKREFAFLLSVVALSLMAVYMVSAVIFTKEIALIALGPVFGGGATAAITSVASLATHKELSAIPWLIFMLQSAVAIPILEIVLKKAMQETNTLNCSKFEVNEEKNALIDRIPTHMKSPAYYLGGILVFSLVAKWIHLKLFAGIGIHFAVVALFSGALLGHFGILDKKPLARADSYGLLLLGLMSLLLETLANTPLKAIIGLLIPVIVILLVAVMSLAICAVILAPLFGIKTYHSLAIGLACMIGFPSVDYLLNKRGLKNEEFIRLTNPWIINGLSIMIGGIVAALL
ncbi:MULTISPECIES: hypothetical protein [unclassified Fusibacter]|uniref:hypothetical protein n=1 Tax=unclassified Fusibacter TaxID=2624464 RepID=UPI0010116130|nr:MULTISPECIES: hypothetical protein [unclassified Fusibacter]MCK8060629.1 hypothetical protein [Fusibacter sp. A2]NPE22917.1 hypothetical protein [Fusibacter sp. A1]RXV59984.1 hypothetical protein DWB64_13815 [Fusibacter sp. A1]